MYRVWIIVRKYKLGDVIQYGELLKFIIRQVMKLGKNNSVGYLILVWIIN